MDDLWHLGDEFRGQSKASEDHQWSVMTSKLAELTRTKGLPPRYRDSVRAITPGLPLFLYNYTTHQLHGIFEAASFGGTNIDPTAWEDKKCKGESRFPAQVRIRGEEDLQSSLKRTLSGLFCSTMMAQSSAFELSIKEHHEHNEIEAANLEIKSLLFQFPAGSNESQT
ncbi:hypothetical protein J5N97_011397 [Dioscorea zingiberensis]|uniref:DCD domain-containing protein n=1 Tax=Dioscorea zingiberensis TaxID=325984 RepID=A0A9D5D2M6_9LILI|nr:hypothetical protein J5N97_011397 [Dioscorea zingiberensis]